MTLQIPANGWIVTIARLRSTNAEYPDIEHPDIRTFRAIGFSSQSVYFIGESGRIESILPGGSGTTYVYVWHEADSDEDTAEVEVASLHREQLRNTAP